MTTPTTSPRSLNMQTLCSLHRATLPLLLDISETLSITPTMQSQTPLKNDSDVYLSTLQPSQHPNMPKKVLRFTNPNPLSEGMRTAMEWRKEQLQRARERWNLRNAQRIQEGHLPMTLHSHALRDYVDSAMDHSSIVMDTTLPNHSPSARENLDTRLLQPPHPDAWLRLKAEVASPSRWLGTSSMPSSNTTTHWMTMPPLSGKKTKIPLRFRRPTLPKGWKYEEDVVAGGEEVVKREEEDPCASSTLRRSSCRRNIMLEDVRDSRKHPYTRTGGYRQKGSNITEGLRTSPSISSTTTGAKSQRASSKSTCKTQTPTSL